jgi:long-chain acyl-CoA synthetase
MIPNFKRLVDIIPYQKINYPKQDAICDKVAGEWRKFSITDCQEIVEKFSLGLLKMGIVKNDKIALISGNRAEWNFVDIGTIQAGAVLVPLYPNISEENYYYIFKDAAVKLVFVSNHEILKKVIAVIKRIGLHIEVFTFDRIDGFKQWTEVTALADNSLKDKLSSIKDSINENDLATIVYTSGTTGIPKGVMLTHKNIVSDVTSLITIMHIGANHRALSFLPLCHIFERTASYFYLAVGTSIYYAESTDKVSEDLLEVKPNYFTTVPRLLEKVYDKIMEKGRELHGVKKAIFGWALDLANNYHPLGNNNLFYNARLAIARKLVFSKWLEALGGDVKGIICGAAALQPRLARIFTAAGIEIVEGYGLTETSPVLTCNRFEAGGNYLGTVGMTIPGVQIKLAENGEILAKGPNVMTGYYNKPEFTKEAIDKDGWFHTGDIGELVDGKFLKITDRIKEIFKLSGGKFVTPQPIENKMRESLFIEQIMVIGENRRFTAALIIPNFGFIVKWAKKKKLDFSNRIEIVTSAEVKERIWLDVEKYNKGFGKVQQIKKIALVEDDWTIESGELTPTLKLKRRILLKKYADLIEKIYEEKAEKHLL